MKLTYQTAIATFAQFATLGLLNIANAVNSIAHACTKGNDCAMNILSSIWFFILITIWFGIICTLGYLAQERRSKRLALLLMGAEALVALVAVYNAKHHTDALGLITSTVDVTLALWVIFLASRLARHGGRRITRSRQRRRPTA